MSTLAKAFVVINLLLGVAFLAVSAVNFAQQQDWKGKYDQAVTDAKKNLAEDERINKEWAAQVVDRDKKIDVLLGEKNTLKVSLEAEQSKLAQLKTDQATLSNNLKELTENYKAVQVASDARQDELDRVKTEKQKAMDDLTASEKAKTAAQDEVVSLNEKAADLKRMIDELNKKIQDQTALLASKERIIAAHYKTYPNLRQLKVVEGSTVPPPIDGLVEDIRDDIGIVVLSVGSEQKVENGFTFYVYRDTDYVALVEVTKVYARKSIATINQEMSKSRIQTGDSATTRIGSF